MKHFLRIATVALTLCSASPTLAGVWIGGGELLESTMNPWFVQAGKSQATANIVRYCVDSDERHFGVPLSSLRLHVQRAIDYWVDEFGAAYLPENGLDNRVLVAKEAFVPLARCTDEALIRFQFGTLTPEQEQEFRNKEIDPRHFVALAVRTSYDEKTLQSKGFVYVAPPSGPLGMATPDMQEDPWNSDNQQRLFAVLSHELGHVFGIQHTGTHQELMGAGFPEFAIAKSDYFLPPRGIFRIPLGSALQKVCYGSNGIPEFLVRFFGIPSNHGCLGLKLLQDRLEIVSAREERDGFRAVGSALFSNRQLKVDVDPLVRVWLPDGQTVFQNVPARLGRLLTGPSVIRRQVTATYRNQETGIARELSLQLAPEQIQISGVWEGKIILDVMRNPNP